MIGDAVGLCAGLQFVHLGQVVMHMVLGHAEAAQSVHAVDDGRHAIEAEPRPLEYRVGREQAGQCRPVALIHRLCITADEFVERLLVRCLGHAVSLLIHPAWVQVRGNSHRRCVEASADRTTAGIGTALVPSDDGPLATAS
ncbi:hypothetical protein D9M71_541680 [compost metagenome]